MIRSEKGKLQALAVAVGLALGSSALLAQEPQDRPEVDSNAQSQQQQFEQEQQRSQDQSSQFEQESQFEQDSQAQSEDLDRQQGGAQSHTASADSSSQGGSLDELSQQHEDLSTFVEAVKAAGLEEALTGDTQYTVFAPTNEALEGQDLEELMKPENRADLVALLRAHIVADDVDSEMAQNLREAQTIDGGSVELSHENDELMVGNAKAVDSGVQLGNLRVYAIDGVIEQDRIQTAAIDEQNEQSQDQQSQGDESQNQFEQARSEFEQQEQELDDEADRIEQEQEQLEDEAEEAAEDLQQ